MKQILVALDPKDHKALKKLAYEKETSMSALVRKCVKKIVKKS